MKYDLKAVSISSGGSRRPAAGENRVYADQRINKLQAADVCPDILNRQLDRITKVGPINIKFPVVIDPGWPGLTAGTAAKFINNVK